MTETSRIAIVAADVPVRTQPSVYPEPFASRMAGREKRLLGELFGLSDFGVNLTRLKPGSCSSLRHAHATQDEFIYVLCGNPTLITDRGETPLTPGMCAGFPAAGGDAHHLVNRSEGVAVFLEVGSRAAGDSASYPDDDIQALLGSEGEWVFARKDGSPY